MPTDPRLATYFKLRSLSDALLGLRPHASNSASLNLLWNVLDATIRRLSEDLTALDFTLPSASRILARWGEIADFFHWVMHLLPAAEATRIPNAVIAPLEAMVQDEAPEARMAVCFDWEPAGYSSRPSLGIELRQLVEEVFSDPGHSVVRSVPPVLAALSFPAAERDNILLHSTLAHEVGHVLVFHAADVDSFARQSRLAPDDEALRDAARVGGPQGSVPGQPLTLFEQPRYNELRQDTVKILTSWLNELLSDAHAIYLLGPAPLLSLYDLGGVQAYSETHPPSCLRFPLMLECLSRSGFWPCTDPELGWLHQRLVAIQNACSVQVPTNDVRMRVVFDCLSQEIAHVAAYIMEPAARTRATTPYTYGKWASLYSLSGGATRHVLVDRILNYVIPNAIPAGSSESAAELAAIMNAGWAVYLGHWDTFCAGLGFTSLQQQYEARRKLFSLLLKAVDAAYLRQQWR